MEIIAGHRRHHGGDRAGLEEMPCIVQEMRNSNKQRGDPLPASWQSSWIWRWRPTAPGGPPKTEKEAEALGKLSVEIVGK